MRQRDDVLTTRDNRMERQRPIELRMCLRCDHWMRSTSADHRICNPCRNSDRSAYSLFRRAGERLPV